MDFSVSEICEMTPAMVLDAATYTINAQDEKASGAGTRPARPATQEDYDNF